ncbi:hypothetical protein D3C73_896580 [compost metagenome]
MIGFQFYFIHAMIRVRSPDLIGIIVIGHNKAQGFVNSGNFTTTNKAASIVGYFLQPGVGTSYNFFARVNIIHGLVHPGTNQAVKRGSGIIFYQQGTILVCH